MINLYSEKEWLTATHINKSKSQKHIVERKKQVTEELYYKIQMIFKNINVNNILFRNTDTC